FRRMGEVMELMSNMKRIAALLMMVVTIAGCQKAPESTPIRGGGSGPRANGEAPPTTGSTTDSGLVINGLVTSSNEPFFNELMKDFMAGSIDPQYVGWVSASGQHNTGVFIGGRVSLAGGAPIKSVNQPNAQLNPDSELFVMVVDYVPNQNPEPLPPTYFKKLDVNQSSISGNSATLVFYDARGFVEMKGTFDGNYFTGRFYFDTQQTWDGQLGGAGNLGDFRVPTCQFFRCQ
ncbi:MAG: hypothetical protein V4760_09565, partial [Bdellovibrionota bacterium]